MAERTKDEFWWYGMGTVLRYLYGSYVDVVAEWMMQQNGVAAEMQRDGEASDQVEGGERTVHG